MSISTRRHLPTSYFGGKSSYNYILNSTPSIMPSFPYNNYLATLDKCLGAEPFWAVTIALSMWVQDGTSAKKYNTDYITHITKLIIYFIITYVTYNDLDLLIDHSYILAYTYICTSNCSFKIKTIEIKS